MDPERRLLDPLHSVQDGLGARALRTHSLQCVLYSSVEGAFDGLPIHFGVCEGVHDAFRLSRGVSLAWCLRQVVGADGPLLHQFFNQLFFIACKMGGKARRNWYHVKTCTRTYVPKTNQKELVFTSLLFYLTEFQLIGMHLEDEDQLQLLLQRHNSDLSISMMAWIFCYSTNQTLLFPILLQFSSYGAGESRPYILDPSILQLLLE